MKPISFLFRSMMILMPGLFLAACGSTEFQLDGRTYVVTETEWGESKEGHSSLRYEVKVHLVEIFDGMHDSNDFDPGAATIYLKASDGGKYQPVRLGRSIKGGTIDFVEGEPIDKLVYILIFDHIPDPAGGMVLHVDKQQIPL